MAVVTRYSSERPVQRTNFVLQKCQPLSTFPEMYYASAIQCTRWALDQPKESTICTPSQSLVRRKLWTPVATACK